MSITLEQRLNAAMKVAENLKPNRTVSGNNIYDLQLHISEAQNLLKDMESSSGIIQCLSSEIKGIHYQKRERMQKHLHQLLDETKQKGNLVEELVYALETYLNK